MATRTVIFGFIRVKTMANFRKGTWKLRENIRCIVGGEIITNIKTHYLHQQPKKFHRRTMNVPESDAR